MLRAAAHAIPPLASGFCRSGTGANGGASPNMEAQDAARIPKSVKRGSHALDAGMRIAELS